MKIEPLPPPAPRINPRDEKMTSSILRSSPPRFETALVRPKQENTADSDCPPFSSGCDFNLVSCKEEEKVNSSDSPPLLLGCDSDSVFQSPKEEETNRSGFGSLFWDTDSASVGAGLCNEGNTCYLNSVLQCIIHTVPVVEKLRSYDHYHRNSGHDSDFCSLCALMKLVDLSISRSGSFVVPTDFTENLRKISPDFWLGIQQDAHEFLLCLLDDLHKCCLEPNFKDQPSSMDKDSIVKHVYGGRSISQLRCSECGHCSNTPEPLLDLSLEIADANTLTDALESFTKVEKIEETKFTCEGCKSQVLMEKQTKIDQAPPVISLHLKRFRNNGQFIHKIDKFVEYPLELDLRPFISCPKDEEQTIYELYAVLVHRGVASFGHYYCCIRSSPTTWHSMDDSMVYRVSQTDVLNEMAYILFYIKQGSSPWFSSSMEAQNIKHTSPVSVLDCRGGIFSPSSAEETGSSSTRETPDKEEPGPCHDVSPESATATDQPDHSPCTSHKCDDTSHKKGPHNALMNRFQAHHTKRPNSGQIVINMDDVFHDEPLEDEKENNLIPQINVEPKGNQVRADVPETMKRVWQGREPLKRLVRSMPSSRRSGFMACLPPEERSPLTSKSQPLNKKRQRL